DSKPSRPSALYLPSPPYVRGQRPFSFARRSSWPNSGPGISLALSLFSWLPRPCVWPLPLSFPLPVYLDCYGVSVVKSSAYRRRKQLTYKLHPTTRNRLAVIAAGSRSLQPFGRTQVNLQNGVCSVALSIVEGQQNPVIRFRRTRKEWRT